MLATGGTLGLMILVILIGRNKKETRLIHYLMISVIALIQVAVVLFVMYTMETPSL